MSSRTSLVIAHRLSTIRNADQILVVDAGTSSSAARHAELLAAAGSIAISTRRSSPTRNVNHRCD